MVLAKDPILGLFSPRSGPSESGKWGMGGQINVPCIHKKSTLDNSSMKTKSEYLYYLRTEIQQSLYWKVVIAPLAVSQDAHIQSVSYHSSVISQRPCPLTGFKKVLGHYLLFFIGLLTISVADTELESDRYCC